MQSAHIDQPIHKCEGCHDAENPQSTNAKFVLDPFQHEIHDRIVYVWLCDACYQNRLMDI